MFHNACLITSLLLERNFHLNYVTLTKEFCCSELFVLFYQIDQPSLFEGIYTSVSPKNTVAAKKLLYLYLAIFIPKLVRFGKGEEGHSRPWLLWGQQELFLVNAGLPGSMGVNDSDIQFLQFLRKHLGLGVTGLIPPSADLPLHHYFSFCFASFSPFFTKFGDVVRLTVTPCISE
jgi:hypothetical protein